LNTPVPGSVTTTSATTVSRSGGKVSAPHNTLLPQH
jgi:hypothetical protein